MRRRKVKREGDEKKERNGNKKKRGCMFVCVCVCMSCERERTKNTLHKPLKLLNHGRRNSSGIPRIVI